MQFDMFANDSGAANLDVSPPILIEPAAWMPPETIAFNEALHRGSLADAIAIMKPLKMQALSAVLLASGFSLPATNNRRAFLFLMQADIVEAARKRMTGRELLDVRRAEKAVRVEARGRGSFNPADYALAFAPSVKVGDFVTHTDGFNYVVEDLFRPNHVQAFNSKVIQAIRPREGGRNKRRIASFTPDEAKLAKIRYEVEEAKAIIENSPALATSTAYSAFIRENTELSEVDLIRFNDAIYGIESFSGKAPYVEVVIKRYGASNDDVPNAAQRMTISYGEARSARRAFFPQVASFDEKLAKSELVGAFGDVIRRGNALNVQMAGELKPGSVVVDESGAQYLAFSARFGYLEVFPFGSDGKPAVFAGNQVFFHLDAATASAYPDRRHDPIFVVNEMEVDNANDLMQTDDVHDAGNTGNKTESENDTAIDGSEGLRPGTGAEDRGDGDDSHRRGKPLDVGVASSGGGTAGNGDVPGLPDGPSGAREGRSRRLGGFASPEPSGDIADARGQRGAADGGIDRNLNSGANGLPTQAQLNSLLVTDMTDEQLLQARVVFAEHRRSESIERQIQKRGLDQTIGAPAPVAVPKQPKTVRLPTEISEAIEADLYAQKARYMRLQSSAKRTGNTLEQRLSLQKKAEAASVALRNMRLTIFAAEDAAVLAIEAGQSHRFYAHAVLFPKAFAAVSAHVTSLEASVTPDNPWNGLSVAAKTEVLKRSGWVTGNGDLNFVGKRILNEPWAEIHETTKATITRNLPAAAVGMDSVATAPLASVVAPASPPSAPVHEFRDPDTLNALVNPILDGDWFKLGAEEWQVRNGYSGRGWSLVKDRSLHPVVRNLDAQVDFMRAVIEATELARATPQEVAGTVQGVTAPVASIAPATVAGVNRDNDVPLMAAARLLSKLTNERNNIWMLAGRDSVQQRVQVMAALLGREKVTQAEAGVTAIRAEFYKRAGIDANTTARGAEVEFQDWVGRVTRLEVDSQEAGFDASLPVLATGMDSNFPALASVHQERKRLDDGIADLGKVIQAGYYSAGYPWETNWNQVSGSSMAMDGKDILAGFERYSSEGMKLRDAIRHAEVVGDVVPDIAYQRLESLRKGVAIGSAGEARSVGGGVLPTDLAAQLQEVHQVNGVDDERAKEVWAGLAYEAKAEILKKAGFVNSQGDLTFVGTRLTGESWKAVRVHKKAKNGVVAYIEGQSAAVNRLGMDPVHGVDASGVLPELDAAADAPALASVGEQQNGSALDAVTVAEPNVPNAVRDRVQWALDRMADVQNALVGVEKARGDGAILALEWTDQSPNLVRPREVLDEFRKLALNNGVDAEEFLNAFGGVPDFSRFEGILASSLDGTPVDKAAGVDSSAPAPERSMYPFGKTDLEDRFFGSIVRVAPDLRGDTAWEGEVGLVLNGGRLITVKRAVDGGRDYMPVRISGDRIEVLSLKDSQVVLAEKDQNIGRTWNTTDGKATITALLYPKRAESSIAAMYEYTNEKGALFRVSEDEIEETIQRNEFDASPEGIARREARELAYAKAQADKEVMNAKMEEIKAHDDVKLAPFFDSTDYSAMKIGQAKKVLLAPVRREGQIIKLYELVEILAGGDLKMEVVMEDRIKPMGRMAAFRADNQAQAAHERRIKEAGKKKVHYIGGFEVGAFEFAYAGFVRDRLHLEQTAGIPMSVEPSVVDPEIDRLFTGGAAVDVSAVEGALTSLVEDGVDGASAWSAKTHVQLVTDDVSKLRGDDVYRLFEELPKEVEKFDGLRAYIVENRPDLLSVVVDAIDEVGLPARPPQNDISVEQKAANVSAQHAKARQVMDFLVRGKTVRLATQTKVLELNSASQIKLASDGVYVAEGGDKNSSDGVRWVHLFDNQVNSLAAQAGAPVTQREVDSSPLGQDDGPDAMQSVAEADEDHAVAVAIDYEITDDDAIGQGGLAEKFRDNLRAIEVLRVLDTEKRHAVPSEKRALSRYVGWGGLKGVFDPGNKQWEKQRGQLRAVLSDAEWNAASSSQLNAHYTSPIVVNAMYSGLSRLGFAHGRMLEPSVGVGNFFGMMPASMRNHSNLHGVELDILTSQIVSALYPSAKISKATGFQDYGMPAGYFDVVIGNPPFGRQILADEKGSAYSGWTIHNYFFAKSIEMLRPGGIMPMVVSHNFLDKLDPHVRQWISRRAELVSGVRLPNTAFKENANTEVVTDILIFKRLDYEHSLGKQEAPDWLETTDIPLENGKTGETEMLAINNYFLKNPQNIFGTNSAAGSMYRANEYTVLPNGDLKEQLAQWVETLPKDIYVPIERSLAELESSAVEIPESVKEGSYFMQGAEVWQRLPDLNGEHRATKWEAPNNRAIERMIGMIEIRNTLRLQMKYERASSGVTLEMIEDNRAVLNRLYDAFQKKNGYLNDNANRRIFMDDTESALIQALEFDYEKSIGDKKAEELGIEPRAANAVKADIFKTRVLFPPGKVEVVQTAKDALLHSLNYTGGVDMEYMQQAYGKSEAEIVEELGDVLYIDPVDGLVTADLYLSGDVKTKLKEATKAAIDDVSFSKNVDALTKVQPQDKLPSEIHVTPGSSWVPKSIFSEFAREISGGDTVYNYVNATGQWLAREVNRPDMVKNHVDFGTQRIGAVSILNLMMNSRAPEIKEKVDGKYVTDQAATEAARQKADKIRAHWDSWIWKDADRAEKLTSIYNDKFNRTVERKYDGSHMTCPGMSPAITLLNHQKNGVWRGLQERTILLDQVVGAGKTYEGIAMLMEMRRLGITKKPLIAVPNHLTLQWRSDFYRLYPGANVLAATPQDFEKDNRERFFSKVVTGNWDAVIVGHSSLKKIPVPLEAETKIIKEQYDDISEAIEDLKNGRGDRNVIRDMETIKINLGAKISRLKEKGGKKDDVVNFEDLGVDALFVDEMHEFKNLFFTTQMNRVSGLGNPAGSGKAFDMFVKIRWLRETYGQDAPLITATGTPVSNSLAEMFTMQRYMQYDKLKENNLHVFDAWAKQYGDVQTVYEVAPSGNGYRLSQRFAKFKNLASLMGEYRSFADVVTLDDLKAQEVALGKSFPVPIIEGGKPNNVVAQRSALQERFFGIPELRRNDDGKIVFSIDLNSPIKIGRLENGKFAGKRLLGIVAGEEIYQQFGGEFETEQEAAYAVALGAVTPAMHIDPDSIIGQFENLPRLVKESNGMINALSLTTQANKAGLDFRLINPSAPDFPDSKVNQAIKSIVEIGKKWEDDKGTQLIFCDLSVPLSAQAKMASKDKRVYVRDDFGNLTHKTGTLHSLKENSGAAYFVVADGKGKSKTFSIFDSHTGQLMKDGLDSKADAHEFVKEVFKDGSRKNDWYLSLEKSRPISADEIDEYKNECAIDTDVDTMDQEISLHDIEGVSGGVGFSIYDDMKAKLIANGVPAKQIEFIHDHDTPQSKAFLFKRVNDGDVRYLFGSTPKMGAGTNVQKRLVALHHIDAPWRPSDLEQREGRIIRRGNELYERDPEGFRIEINRYATSQTYDTRRWQLLEHKAAGVEQLRKYTGANEIEDVSTEAANSADMKAAASGNPLILKETQLANEVKSLRLLYRAHQDGEYLMNSKARSESYYAENTGPHYLENLKSARASLTESANSGVIGRYGEKPLHTKEEVAEAMNAIGKSLSAADNLKVISYRGVNFGFQKDHLSKKISMVMPVGDTILMENFSPSGAVTRMNNWCESLDKLIDHTEKRIVHSASLAQELYANTGKPFPQSELLSAKVEEHGKVQRALMKSNAVAAVKPENAAEFNAAVELQKQKLREYGLGMAVDGLEMNEGIETVALTSLAPDRGASLVVSNTPQELDAEIKVAPAVELDGGVGDGAAALSLVQHGDLLFNSMPVGMQKKLTEPAIILRTGDTVSRKTFVDDLFENGFSKVNYYGEAKGSHMGFLLNEESGKKMTLDSHSLYYADQTISGSLTNRKEHVVPAPMAPGADMESYIKVAANSISELRKVDVFRVLVESNRVEHQANIAAYIKQKRSDLVNEVDTVMQEAAQERTAAVPAVPGAQILSSAPDVSTEGEIVDTVGSGALPGLDGVKARMVDVLPVEVPEGWILMNAPRPLLGQKIMEGAFVSGRHYAALDPDDSMTQRYLKENVALDARVVVAVPRDVQMEVALHGNEYRGAYMEYDAENRYKMLASQLDKLQDLPFGELKKAVFEAKGGVENGIYSGKVLGNVAGVVAQNTGRFGTVVHHDASKLSMPVRVGEVVSITYQGGKGFVSGISQSRAVGR